MQQAARLRVVPGNKLQCNVQTGTTYIYENDNQTKRNAVTPWRGKKYDSKRLAREGKSYKQDLNLRPQRGVDETDQFESTVVDHLTIAAENQKD